MRSKTMKLVVAAGIFLSAVIWTLAAIPDPNNPTGGSGLIMIDKRGGFVRVRLPAGESAGGR